MDAADIPVKFAAVFAHAAAGGFIATPVATTTSTPDVASLALGFPPATFASGGAPRGQDFNGLLFQVTGWNQWQQAGGPITYDGAFQTAVSGYPLSAIVQSATTPQKFFITTTDGNVTNPDSAGAGWDTLIPVPNKYLATMATKTVKANITGGTAAPVDVTLAAFLTALGLTPFVSSPLAISGTALSAAHSLGAQPTRWTASLVNVNTEFGYTTGQEIALPATTYTQSGGGTGAWISVWADGTNVGISWGNSSFICIEQITGGTMSTPNSNGYITPGNWNIILRAWLN